MKSSSTNDDTRQPSESGKDLNTRETSGSPSSRLTLQLRTIIVLLVLFSTVLVAVITVSIGVITNSRSISSSSDQASQSIQALAIVRQTDASAYIISGIESYILQMQLASQTMGTIIASGTYAINDPDNLLPLFNATLSNFGIANRVTVFGTNSLINGRNSWFIGKNAIIKTAGFSLGLLLKTTNATCQRFCPVNSTNGGMNFYGLDASTLNIQSLITFLPVPEDPSMFARLPRNAPLILGPQVYPDEIVQPMFLGLYDTHGVQVGTSYIAFSVQKFCSMLDSAKGSATQNTLFYVLSSSGDVLAISGLGNITVQTQTLKKVINPSLGIFALNNIYDYDAGLFPLLNLSASAVLKYAGGNLASSFADNTWQVGAYLFSVTTKNIWGYRYIVVTAAPLEDYLGDTIHLADNLKRDGVNMMITVILSAFVVVFVMSLFAIVFVLFFIARPLSDILSTMKKATKFDFSDLRNGQLKTRISIVKEIHHFQDHFTEMVKVFANALKQNKALANRTISGPGETGSSTQKSSSKQG